jgi:ribokinase
VNARDWELVVVGSANADLVVGVQRRPGAGETVLGSDLVVHPGGKGANQAVAAARLGAAAALLARVGEDAHGRLLAESLREAGVDTGALLAGGAPTGVALITVDPDGDNSIVVSPGANSRLTPADVRAAEPLIAGARVVSLQLEIPLETVAEAAAVARRHGTRVVLNPSPPARLPREVLAACDPLVVNEHEARVLMGDAGSGGAEKESGPEAWARALIAEAGCRSVVVTLGAAGAVVAESPGEPASGEQAAVVTTRVATPRVKAVDTTGAGDAFAAALAWRLGRGEALTEAARYAVRVGAAAVTRAGAQQSYPTPSQVDALPAADAI